MNKRIRMIEAAILAGGLAILAAGCMDVTPARVERVGVEAVKLGTFAPETYPEDSSSGIPTATMRNVKAFLWGAGLPPAEVNTVKRISRLIDQYEDESVRLTKRREFLEGQAEGAYGRYKEALAKIESNTRVRDLFAGKLAQELAKPAEQQDAKKVEMYRKKVEEAETAIAAAQTAKTSAEADAAGAGLDFGAIETEITEIEEKKNEFSDKGTVEVNNLSRTVSFFAQLDAIRISFPPEGVQVEVDEWDVCLYNDPDSNEGTRTEPLLGEYRDECLEYTVENVSYDPAGGRVKFTIDSAAGAKYHFDIVRTRYNDEFGRLFMQGRIKAEFDVPGGVVTRHGIIKLVDRKN